MPMEFTSKVMKVGNSLMIVLPKAVCDGFKIQKGDTIKMRVKDDGIRINLVENLGEEYQERSGEEHQESSGETSNE